MKKVFLFLVMCFVSILASAEIDTRGLTETQKAELALKIAKMKESANQESTLDTVVAANNVAVNVAEKWTGVGKALATGIVETAKELGVAANDFAATPLGKIATGLIIWNYMGKNVLQIFVAFSLVFIGLPVLWKVYRWMVIQRIEYYEYKSWFFNLPRVKVKSVITTSGEAFAFPTIIFMVLSIIDIVCAANILMYIR